MLAMRTLAELQAGLEPIRQSPVDEGRVELIVRRPRTDEREVLEAGELDPAQGLVGDAWIKGVRGRPANLDAQLTLMNSRAARLIAGEPERWPLAGDQLFVDLDLSGDNLPPGTRLTIGEAELEITPEPHTGCKKFSARFGPDALKFVNMPEGRALNLRGIYAKVIRGGTIRRGDTLTRHAANQMA